MRTPYEEATSALAAHVAVGEFWEPKAFAEMNGMALTLVSEGWSQEEVQRFKGLLIQSILDATDAGQIERRLAIHLALVGWMRTEEDER